jgi:hypothetical protein
MPTEIAPLIEGFRRHRLAIGAVALVLALAIALAWAAWRWGIAEDRMAMLQQQADAGFLQAPSSNRTVRIDLRAPGTVSVGGGEFPERIDFLLNARSTRFARFRVSLLHEDGTLLFHADQMVRDSNFDLRLSLNTSVLPPGDYRIRIEGYARGARREPFAEARLRVS